LNAIQALSQLSYTPAIPRIIRVAELALSVNAFSTLADALDRIELLRHNDTDR
jgi:hypothetical protein